MMKFFMNFSFSAKNKILILMHISCHLRWIFFSFYSSGCCCFCCHIIRHQRILTFPKINFLYSFYIFFAFLCKKMPWGCINEMTCLQPRLQSGLQSRLQSVFSPEYILSIVHSILLQTLFISFVLKCLQLFLNISF